MLTLDVITVSGSTQYGGSMTLCNLVRVKGHRNNLKAKEAVPLVTHLYYIDLCGSTLLLKVHY
jgi:hypothetical protein